MVSPSGLGEHVRPPFASIQIRTRYSDGTRNHVLRARCLDRGDLLRLLHLRRCCAAGGCCVQSAYQRARRLDRVGPILREPRLFAERRVQR
jgi:hypothetical protein